MFDMNPKKMQAVMKQMGMSQEEIAASKVTIERPNDSKIVIEPASVTKIKIQGQESFQISGEVKEESNAPSITESDIKTVMEKADCSKKQAKEALEKTGGDLAEAILGLGK